MPIYNSFIECLALVLLVLDSTQYAEGTRYTFFTSSSPSTTCSASPSYEYEIQDQFEYKCNPDDGTYALSVSWIHDATLLDNIACPGTPPIPCYQDFAPDIIAATGLFGVSVDFQPCGHPQKGFVTTHYDVHFYRDPVEVREQRICAQPPRAPICDPTPLAQTTSAGRAFFNVNYMLGTTEVANMPDNFECGLDSGIPGSGIHCEDVSSIPDTPGEWVFPAFVMGSYDFDIAFVEPMAPLGFVLGEEGYPKSYTQFLTYNGQTIMNLPTSYKWSNDDTTNRTTILLEGVATDGTCPPTPEIACGEFEVVCDANIQALGVDCVLLNCVDCTPRLVDGGVNCMMTPEPTEPPASVEISAPAPRPPAPKPPIKPIKVAKKGKKGN